MSNPVVTTTFGNPDPNANPVTIGDLVTILNTLVTSAIQGSYVPYVIGSNTPSVDDQDKAWIVLDNSKRPIAVKTFYNGNWRRVYNGAIGDIKMYSGNPGDTTNGFDSDGLGLIGGDNDGWHLCNGNGGTINLTDKFIVSAHMDNSNSHTMYNSGWQTFVDGVSDLQNGGVATTMIAAQHLPPFDATAGSSKVTIHGFEAKETSPSHTNVSVLVDVHYSDLLPHDAVIGNYGSGPNDSPPVPQVGIPTLPPFIALGFAQFVGYA